MILTCPSCETQYFADASTLSGKDRTVRCAACGHSWTVNLTDAQLDADNPNVAHAAMRERMREKRVALNKRVAMTTWISSFAVFALVIAGLVLARDRVAATWPQSASAFRAVGLDVNRFGLEFQDYTAARTFDDTVPILTVEGQVKNITGRTISGPLVLISLIGEDGEEVGYMTSMIEPFSLSAQGVGNFRATLKNPPFETVDLAFSFVDPEDAPEDLADVRRPL